MNRISCSHRTKPTGRFFPASAVLLSGFILGLGTPAACAASVHVWEKTEVTFRAGKAGANPYTDTKVWVDLKGPDFEKRCYGFWDGSNTFRVRVLATAPGEWKWRSGSEPEDRGLSGVSGSFVSTAWSDAEKAANPNRRGMIHPSSNGHAFQYADGTLFFLVGDTWWAVPTFRFRWFDDDTPRPLGPAAGFKEYVRFREQQQFNCITYFLELIAK